MDYFDFEDASNALPTSSLDFDDTISPDDFERGEAEARAELEAQRVEQPNPYFNTRAYGTTINIKLINNKEVEAVLWDHNDGTNYPMFRAKDACSLCARMGLDCFLASRGSLITGCTCCISLFRECSFTHDEIPQGYVPTFSGIAEDTQVNEGSSRLVQSMRSFDDSRGRKNGARFPREAVKILKKWLSEHHERPYPSEREKDELKNLTGLKRSQISNWLANARRRGKVRPPSGPGSPTMGAIDIPAGPKQEYASLNPMDRWKASPPEHEPALVTDIARAVASQPLLSSSNNASNSSLLQSRANSRTSSRKASSEEESSWSVFREPSESSFDTRASSQSDFSLASSRSHKSRASLASSQDRRRRRRAPMTQRAVAQATKSRNTRIFQCTFCTDTFPAKYDWQRHEKSLHLALERWTCCPIGGVIEVAGQTRCAFCPELNPSTDHLETHNYTACCEKSIQERTFYRKDHLRQHLRLMHNCKFNSAMEAWKTATTEIKSRCGFCPAVFVTWQQRADHLAAHFKNGMDMVSWSGNWGFEPCIEASVENAIPPYLIGHERNTMNPYVARTRTSPSALTPGLTSGSSPGSEHFEVDQLNRDSNCWNRLQEELIKYISEQKSMGLVPTDQQIQCHARTVIYGDSDPLDWTAADNQTWLDAFRYQNGIGPCPADINLQSTCTVPMTAPYVVKGGRKTMTKRMSNCGMSYATSSANMTPITPVNEAYDFALPEAVDPDFDVDFDAVDFSGLDLDGLDDAGFGMSTDFISQPGSGIFGQFDMGMSHNFGPKVPQQSALEEHDMSQLTGYMSGFQ